jgi:hypothetical protein
VSGPTGATDTVGNEGPELPEAGEAWFYLVAYEGDTWSGFGTASAGLPREVDGGGCE